MPPSRVLHSSILSIPTNCTISQTLYIKCCLVPHFECRKVICTWNSTETLTDVNVPHDKYLPKNYHFVMNQTSIYLPTVFVSHISQMQNSSYYEYDLQKLQGPFKARATCFWKLHSLEVISDFDATSFIFVALMPGSVP